MYTWRVLEFYSWTSLLLFLFLINMRGIAIAIILCIPFVDGLEPHPLYVRSSIRFVHEFLYTMHIVYNIYTENWNFPGI